MTAKAHAHAHTALFRVGNELAW